MYVRPGGFRGTGPLLCALYCQALAQGLAEHNQDERERKVVGGGWFGSPEINEFFLIMRQTQKQRQVAD